MAKAKGKKEKEKLKNQAKEKKGSAAKQREGMASKGQTAPGGPQNPGVVKKRAG